MRNESALDAGLSVPPRVVTARRRARLFYVGMAVAIAILVLGRPAQLLALLPGAAVMAAFLAGAIDRPRALAPRAPARARASSSRR